MPELPCDMLRRGRQPDNDFADSEELYRAFGAGELEGDRLAMDAIELPDLSVNRGKYGPAHCLLTLDRFQGCGVAACTVGDIPAELEHLGRFHYYFRVAHDPTENNWPHSVIQAFDENQQHIQDKDLLDPDLHLRWRNRLRQRLRVRIRPEG
jgi:hypothetical protein